jgi:hypothetical protein
MFSYSDQAIEEFPSIKDILAETLEKTKVTEEVEKEDEDVQSKSLWLFATDNKFRLKW